MRLKILFFCLLAVSTNSYAEIYPPFTGTIKYIHLSGYSRFDRKDNFFVMNGFPLTGNCLTFEGRNVDGTLSKTEPRVVAIGISSEVKDSKVFATLVAAKLNGTPITIQIMSIIPLQAPPGTYGNQCYLSQLIVR